MWRYSGVFCATSKILTFTLAGLSLGIYDAQAQPRERFVKPPPEAQVLRGQAVIKPLATQAPTVTSAAGEAVIDLVIDKTDATVYNPTLNTNDKVSLRSYRDANATSIPPVPFVAPTI